MTTQDQSAFTAFRTAFVQRVVARHDVLHHAFLTRFHEIGFERFRTFVWEQSASSTSFAGALEAALQHAEDVDIDGTVFRAAEWALPLQAFLNVERWNPTRPGTHGYYFARMADTLNINLVDLLRHRPSQPTMDYVMQRQQWCQAGPFPVAIASLAAMELANETIFRYWLHGAEAIFQTNSVVDLSYFRVHVEGEADDFDVLMRLLAPYLGRDDGMEERMLAVADAVLDARRAWLDFLGTQLLPAAA